MASPDAMNANCDASPMAPARDLAVASFKIAAPDGKIHDSTTGADGCARIEPIAAGTCQTSFTMLDAEAWEKI